MLLGVATALPPDAQKSRFGCEMASEPRRLSRVTAREKIRKLKPHEVSDFPFD
jgi:hypothetical protein